MPSNTLPNRTSFSAADIIHDIWTSLQLPPHALSSISLPDQQPGPATPSSFKIGHLAQSSIALSALAASLVHSHQRSQSSLSSSSSSSSSPSSSSSSSSSTTTTATIPRVTVPLRHALLEFQSERLYTINSSPPESSWGSIGGLHATLDGGHVRIHDVLPNHALGALSLLSLPPTATRHDVARQVLRWNAVDLETAAAERGSSIAVIYALRSYDEWDAHPQAAATPDDPIILRPLGPATPPNPLPPPISSSPSAIPTGCLKGLRVLEMSRVIAAPVAGRCLAAHGADVLWVTSPSLPSIPPLDKDLSRGKRTIQLDIRNNPSDKQTLLNLLRTCDVFIQSYRPGSLAAHHGLSPQDVQQQDINPHIIYANLSAFGPYGPWATRRGFDSLVQTCSGMNVSEAAHFGAGETARALPCQALDHAAGYLLATGILAALHRRTTEGGSWVVDVSLAGVGKYLRSLGQYPDRTGFEGVADAAMTQRDVPGEFLETRETAFGRMVAVRHSASVEGCEVGWGEMPKPLGSDEARWLE
ncbi:uncharacterized protein TRIREDRAFT_53373 [Trichoderma reesei QM6a]|jgi:hypothetical protein|uniref:Predicted protein n=2 Tax=Hypocrea jecorina TaxID=51453 RepID=G0R8N3_HYPJQ|nr:uncharacterized protein TRIREDRAFT_53373 [Trichoderma reesei QM6a]EGR52911.1 predicted protein [Trichoderma reesei QM6a]ETS06741.1 CoA-transferase family III [Trichoderma reesei RUT C-30]